MQLSLFKYRYLYLKYKYLYLKYIYLYLKYRSLFQIEISVFKIEIVLGSFQCRSVPLPWHLVGQGPAVLGSRCGRGGLCFIFF